MRLGTFAIDVELVRDFSTLAKRVMGQCIITRAEHHYSSKRIVYEAISEHFRDLPPNTIPPHYEWVSNDDGHLTAWEQPA